MRVYPELTVDGEFKSLGDLGHSGSLNDRQFSFLRSRGYTNGLADMFFQYRSFSPLSLFSLSEPGVWYDPSDLTTMFQDTTGTTPVTTAGQTVALLLDKSKGLVLGSELVTNGDFSGGTTGWTAGTGSTISVVDGRLRVSRAVLSTVTSMSFPTVVGRSYKIRAEIVNGTGRVAAGAGDVLFASGEAVFTAIGTTTSVAVRVSADGATCDFDNISVKELPGNHATQATAASRPTYGVVPKTGRRNLLTFTEQFDNAVWAKSQCGINANVSTAPDGSISADRLTSTGSFPALSQVVSASGNVTFSLYAKDDGSGQIVLRLVGTDVGGAGQTQTVYRFTFSSQTFTLISGGTATVSSQSVGSNWFRLTLTCSTSTCTGVFIYPRWSDASAVSVLVWGAQLELGSSATAYQRVVSAFDVTEAGVQSLSYLSFDGVDDFLVTPTITPGVDKAQVFAGVRTIGSTQGFLAELSASTATNNGAWNIQAPLSAAGEYRFVTKGTSTVAIDSLGITPPNTRVLTTISDIVADSAVLRLNGSQVAQSTADQGTGNFLAYPLYIGRRAGTSLPFNGQIYSLVVRFGANLNAGTITSTELWVGGKTPEVLWTLWSGVWNDVYNWNDPQNWNDGV